MPLAARERNEEEEIDGERNGEEEISGESSPVKGELEAG
jgi:hypothetical protein